METTDTVLVFEMTQPWYVAGVWLALCGAFAMAWWGLRRSVARTRQILLLSLRAAFLVCLGLVLMWPSLQHRTKTPLRSRLGILVDTSESMSLKTDGQTRAQQVHDFLRREKSTLDQLASRYTLELYGFDREARPLPWPRDLGIDTPGDHTDLLKALSATSEGRSGGEQDLSALVLLSDGADTERLSGLTREEALPGAVRQDLVALGVPVNCIVVGGTKPIPDLSVTEVVADDFAFIRNAVEVTATLSSEGLGEMTVPVVLEQGGRTLVSKVVTVPAQKSAQVSFRFVPDTVGKFVYRVVAPISPGELITENNTKSFVLRVIRDKIRVLHVVGRPAMDQRFLREVLKTNPNVDLVSFYILRTTVDTPGVQENELSLIPFPVSQLFGSELDTFDVVIFQNFNHAPYQVSYFLPQVVEYVRRGGAFCMVGGDLSFGSGGYALTALEDILPVRLSAGDDWRMGEYRAIPTQEGLRHPVLDLGSPGIWDRFPPLGSINVAQSLVPGALILLEHPFERSGKDRAPVLALREVERGRSAAILTDGSWRWTFQFAGVGGDHRLYHHFWNNLLRWLIRDPALHPLSLRAQKTRYLPTEPISLRVQWRGGGAGSKVRWMVKDATGGKEVLRGVSELGDQTSAEIALPVLPAGAYVASVEIGDGPGPEKAEETFVIEGSGLERARPGSRPDLLKKIAAATGGRFMELSDASLSEVKFRELTRYRFEAIHSRPLLGSFWVVIFLIGLLSVEWWVRRQWGYR